MSNHDRGLRLTREVFQQEIGVMLTDHRCIQITSVMESYPLRSKHQILDWIGANVKDSWQPFPSPSPGDCPYCKPVYE